MVFRLRNKKKTLYNEQKHTILKEVSRKLPRCVYLRKQATMSFLKLEDQEIEIVHVSHGVFIIIVIITVTHTNSGD